MLEKKVILERTRSPKHNLTSYFYKKNIYHKVIYLYFYEIIFQEKSIHMVFVF